MGSPEIADIPVDDVRDLAVEALAEAMAQRAGLAGVTTAVERRAAVIVDATLDRAGRAFVVLVEGSEIDARTLATAVLGVSPKPRALCDGDVAQAAAAISALVNAR